MRNLQSGKQTDSLNHSLKKSILWNVVEPGDPYDIRKSMIARLPGDRKTFMGNKLELVCLLQAAEIQRLALNLEEYRSKFYEVEKSSLDRHSYEVQIKQLAGRVQGQEGLRVQNSKLKNFIERLNQELQENKAKLSSGNQLTNNYQQALLQIQTLNQQVKQLSIELGHSRQAITARNVDNQQLQNRISALQIKLKEHGEENERLEQYEQKFYLLSEEIKRLNSVLKTKTDQIGSLNQEIQQVRTYSLSVKQQNERLNVGRERMSQEVGKLSQEIRRLQGQAERAAAQTQHAELSKYQQKLTKAAQQIQNLNNSFIKIQREKEEISYALAKSEQSLSNQVTMYRQREATFAELERDNDRYQANASMMSKEIQRLNQVLKGKLDDINSLQLRLNRLTQQNQYYTVQVTTLQTQVKEFKSVARQSQDIQIQLSSQLAAKEKLVKTNNDLLRRINQFSLQSQKYANYEQRAEKMIQQNRRINDRLSSLQNENRSLQIRLSQSANLQDFRRANKQLNDLKSVMMQEDINKRNQQERILDLNRKANQYQKLIEDLSAQIQRLNQILKIKLNQNASIQQRLNSVSAQLNKFQAKDASSNEKKRKLQDYQNKFALISLELERVNTNIKIKANEAIELSRQLQGANKQINSLKSQLNQYIQQYNNRREEEESKEMKLVEYRNEILRLNEVSKVRFQENTRQINSLKQQNSQLNQQLDDTLQQLEQAHRHLVQAQEQLQNARLRQDEIDDLQRLNNLLRLKVEQSAKWQASNHELSRKIEFLQQNMERASTNNINLRQQIDLLTTQKNNSLREFNQYQGKIERLFVEVQRLHQVLQTLKNENSQLKRQNIQFRRENSDLKRQSGVGLSLKEKNEKLLKEIQRLNITISQQQAQVKELRMVMTEDYALDRRIREQLSLIVILFAQIQSLRRRIQDKQKEVEAVRRESIVALKD